MLEILSRDLDLRRLHMLEHQWLQINDPSSESVDVTLYRSMIGCLLYLTASRPNIAFSVGVCSRFQANPKVSHLNAIKRIIKYVSGTCDYGLFYRKESNMSLVGYLDANWAGNADNRKSTIGGCFYVVPI